MGTTQRSAASGCRSVTSRSGIQWLAFVMTVLFAALDSYFPGISDATLSHSHRKSVHQLSASPASASGSGCLCRESCDDCRVSVTPASHVYRRKGAGMDRCASQTYQPPYHSTWKVRNSSWPWISEDAYRELSDWLIDAPEYGCKFEPSAVQAGDVIFIKADYLDDFFQHQHQLIQHPYILISHASDLSVPTEFARSKLASGPGNLAQWFAAQLANDHPAIMSYIPLGMNSPGWNKGNGPVVSGHFSDPAQIRATLRKKLVSFLEGKLSKDDKVLAAFSIINNKPERSSALVGAQRLGYDLRSVKETDWPDVLHRTLFIFAPVGNPIGIESHRIWEALVGGALPVVRLGEYEQLLDCLPFVPIYRWEEMTWDDLKAAAKTILLRLDAGGYDFDRLFLDYHAGRIARASQRVKQLKPGQRHCDASPAVQDARHNM